MNESKSSFFENINKTGKPVASWTEKKTKKKTQITKFRNQSGKILHFNGNKKD